MYKHEASTICLVALVLCCLCACAGNDGSSRLSNGGPDQGSGSGSQDGVPSDPVGGAFSGIPPLPQDSDSAGVVRSASAVEIRLGDSFAEESVNPSNRPESGGAYSLIAESPDVAHYIRYSVGGYDTFRPVDLTMDIVPTSLAPGGDEMLPLRYWVAVSDYTTGGWYWWQENGKAKEFTSASTFELNSVNESMRERFTSKSGNIHLLVVSMADPALAGPGNPSGAVGVRINSLALDALSTGTLAARPTKPHITPIVSIGEPAQALGKASSAATGDTSLDISWEHFQDVSFPNATAFQYEVWRKGPDEAEYKHIGSLDSPNGVYTDPVNNAVEQQTGKIPGPKPGATYSYSLRAVSPAIGYSAYSYYPKMQAPFHPPAGFSASNGTFDTKVEVLWTPQAFVDSYRIYRDGTDALHMLAEVPAGVALYDDTAGADGAIHQYYIQGVNEYGVGDISDPDPGYSSNLPAPNVDATDAAFLDKVQITWTSVGGATAYDVFRDGDDVAHQIAADVPSAQLSFDDLVTDPGGVSDLDVHQYYVRAKSPSGPGQMSAPSLESQGSLMGLDAPLNVSATDASFYDKVVVSWDAVTGADSYEVFRDSQTSPVGTSVSSPFEDNASSGLTDSNTHQYWVRARKVDAFGYSGGPDSGSRNTSAPIAQITANPAAYGPAPLYVLFDATQSTDPDDGGAPGAGITKYEFQFEEGGTWFDNGTDPTDDYTFTQRGRYQVSVRVTDNEDITSDPVSIEVGDLRGMWSMFAHDARHTGQAEINGVQGSPSYISLPVGSTITTGMAVDYFNTAYFGTASGEVIGVHGSSQQTLEEVWGTPCVLPAAIQNSTPAISWDGTIYIGCDDGKLYAINSADGTLKGGNWPYNANSGNIRTSPVIDEDGNIYFGTDNGHICSVTPDGTERFRVSIGNTIASHPAIGNSGIVYFGCHDKRLHAVQSDGQNYGQSAALGEAIQGPPAIAANGWVYVGCDDQRLYAFSPDFTGGWSHNQNNIVRQCPTFDLGFGNVYCVDQVSGGGPNQGKIFKLTAGAGGGSEVWPGGKKYADGVNSSSPAVGADGTIYIGNNDWKIYALTSDGTVKWAQTIEQDVDKPIAIGNDGTIIFGNGSKFVKVLGTGI